MFSLIFQKKLLFFPNMLTQGILLPCTNYKGQAPNQSELHLVAESGTTVDPPPCGQKNKVKIIPSLTLCVLAVITVYKIRRHHYLLTDH